MRLAWRLALRDLRASGRGLWLLALCLFIGTAALAGIGSLSASITAALDAQGREALGGDLELRVSQRRATIEERAAFAGRGEVAETIALRGMAGHAGAAVLVDLKAVDGRWPLVGRLAIASSARVDRPRGADLVVAPALAERLGVRVGDDITLGATHVRIGGLIATEPDALGEGFRLGPVALIDTRALDQSGLVQPGSLYTSRYRLRLPAGADARAIGRELLRRFPDAGWSMRLPAESTGALRRSIDQLGQFLLLIGLAALTIAGVGIGSAVDAYLGAKTRTVAMLKVLGARRRTIAAIFLIELALVALAAILAGLAIGAAVPWIVRTIAADALPVPPRLALYPMPLAVAAALDLAVALFFALPPLARAGAIPAAALLRDALAERGFRSWRAAVAMAALAGAIVALAVLTAPDRWIASLFVAATIGLIALLAAIGWAVRAMLRLLPRPRRPLLRLALTNLHSPGAPTVRLVVALGLGFTLFVALAVIDTSLTAEMRDAAPATAPRFFAIDLQPEDEAGFRAAVARAAPGARIETTPSLRGSIVAFHGQRVAAMRPPPTSWVLRGDRTITWARDLPPRNRIVAGRWWPADYRGPPLISIGTDAADALKLKVGDEVTLSVLGVDVAARIGSIRQIDWSALGLNFAIIFSPGLIEEAPHGLLASIYAGGLRDGAIARGVAAAVPSVTMIRVADIIGQIGALLGKIGAAIRSATGITVAAGVAVLIGAVSASGRARRRDAVILKLLGARRSQILAVQALEYGVLAVILATIATLAGGGAGWFVVAHVLDFRFAPDAGAVAMTLAAAIAVTMGVGVGGSLPLLAIRPAEGLRQA